MSIYHVIKRGKQRKRIFFDTDDYKKFYDTLGDIQKSCKITIYAFVLMPNHYHLLIDATHENLLKLTNKLKGADTLPVKKGPHLLELSRYIHLNPLRAGLSNLIGRYRWSSLYFYLNPNTKRKLPFHLNREWIFSSYGAQRDVAAWKYRRFILNGIKK